MSLFIFFSLLTWPSTPSTPIVHVVINIYLYINWETKNRRPKYFPPIYYKLYNNVVGMTATGFLCCCWLLCHFLLLSAQTDDRANMMSRRSIIFSCQREEAAKRTNNNMEMLVVLLMSPTVTLQSPSFAVEQPPKPTTSTIQLTELFKWI